MKIIIAGDGETGTHIANVLSVEGQDVVIMGTDRAHLAELDAINNFITFEGNPVSRTNLLECGVATADLFVAVTPDENANIMACQIAKDCAYRQFRVRFRSERRYVAPQRSRQHHSS